MEHPYRDPSSPRGPHCPRCRVLLIEERIEARALLRCDSCQGLWLPRDLFLDALIEPGLQAGLQAIDHPKSGRDDGAARLACPVCAADMHRGEYGRTSGVMVDVCRPHGVWLDPSEITRILRFVNASAPYQPAAPPADAATAPAGPTLPDAEELRKALFPHVGFWDKVEALFCALGTDLSQWDLSGVRPRRRW